LAGTRLSDDREFLDIEEGSGLRDSQAIISFKGGFGTTAIIYDCEVPRWPIYRLRKDLVVNQEKLPNFMDQRHGGKKKKGSRELWRKKDINKVLGITITVPIRYSGDPEELVELILYMSPLDKAKLRDDYKDVPKQPDI
jgi:hypothetical protein